MLVRLNRISFKLPAFLLGFMLLAFTTSFILSQQNLKDTSISMAREQAKTIMDGRQFALDGWLSAIRSDVLATAINGTTSRGIVTLNQAWGKLGANPTDSLQSAYIDQNPHPLGQRHLLDRSERDGNYHFLHSKLHPNFRLLMLENDYYDIFLFNLEGDTLYTVFKEQDFATNMNSGPFQDTGLARAFQQAKNGTVGQVYFEDFAPYEPSGFDPAAFVAAPVADGQGKIIGVVAFQISVARLNRIINSDIGLGRTGQFILIGQNGLSWVPSRFEDGFDSLESIKQTVTVQQAIDGLESTVQKVLGQHDKMVLSVADTVDFFDQKWVLSYERDLAEVMEYASTALVQQSWFAAIGMVLVSLLSLWFARTLSCPIRTLTKTMTAVSEGDLGAEVHAAKRSDEIGDIGRALVSFKNKLLDAKEAELDRVRLQDAQNEIVQSLSGAMQTLASCDLSQTLTTSFGPEHDQLRENYNRSINTLGEVITAVKDATSNINTRVEGLNASSEDLAQRTAAQASTLEQTSAALNSMVSSVSSAAQNIREMAKVMDETRVVADQSGDVVKQAVAAMTEIEGSSAKVSQFIGLIDDIAFQTNLLALNAGVEAARAGEKGRGFAVVAAEVQVLAQKSSHAASEIKDLIQGSSKNVEVGVQLVGQAGGALQKIVDRIQTVSALVGDISVSAEAQSIGLSEINQGVGELELVTQKNVAMVSDVKVANRTLKDDVIRLDGMVKKFKLSHSVTSATGIGQRNDVPQQLVRPIFREPEKQIMPVQIKTKLADEPTIKAWQDDLDRDVAKKRLPFKDNPNILDGTDPSQWHDF